MGPVTSPGRRIQRWVGIVAARHPVVSSVEILRASAEVGGDSRRPTTALDLGRVTGADVVVIGRVAASGDGFKLAISVRNAKSGRSVGAVLVPLFSALLAAADEARIRPLVLNLLAQAVPTSTINEPTFEELDKADTDQPRLTKDPALTVPAEPLPVVARVAGGLSVTSRSFAFARKLASTRVPRLTRRRPRVFDLMVSC